MTGGFSFCDIDIGSFGLYYVPELENLFVYKPAAAQAHVETYEGHNGGYLYGSWYSPKDFTLRCYFEDSKVDKGIMAQIYALFKVGKSGKLVFDRRPWCYYYATVTQPVEDSFTNYENGLVVIHMQAMYPFARSDVITNTRSEIYHDILMNNSAAFDKAGMETPYSFTNIQQQTNFVLANPGQERAALGIAIAGDTGTGVIISNNTTGQSMKFMAISKAVTTNVGKEVLMDPISGKTILDNKLTFKYHDYGYLELETSYPAIRDVYINYLGGTDIEVINILSQNVIGKYIFVKNQWFKIIGQPDRHTISVDRATGVSGAERSMIIPMNEMTIKPVSTMDITSLRFIFKPTYA